MPSTPDPFDDILNLEDNFYQQGYTQGLADGEKAGRMEGRSFGMQKGFEKFLESGRLASRAVIWANRLPPQSQQDQSADSEVAKQKETKCTLPPLPSNARLDKNVRMVYSLVEPDTLSTENTDEAVQDFDDRVKRAQGKVKVVERMVS
ncbi:hypothetical protein VFPPC_16543 [Pochonia chlamydosporia 170]|uniref:Essential protein Yae1 N-terminal domain-containing protein n=1 Tax=Pochonia chlamydosporia 170 TaxID=1380566 RepID=A0A179F9B5_METCM|nr:hypothetical protein VFPPC_16543 [Pochonia chlamydosporia 170]OAQ61693.1 hypothetical protein VFPPC_16543 [Pochonia chlamydosporia 170]